MIEFPSGVSEWYSRSCGAGSVIDLLLFPCRFLTEIRVTEYTSRQDLIALDHMPLLRRKSPINEGVSGKCTRKVFQKPDVAVQTYR